MTYSNINDLVLLSSLFNYPIIPFSTYIRNKFDCDYWERYSYNLYGSGLLNDKYEYLSEIFNNYKVEISSATYNQIKIITNKYLADKRIYIPGITPNSYYYLSRENSKSTRELFYSIDLKMSDSEDMENLYKRMISQKMPNSYITQNNSTKQRSNNQEEMSCLKLIADRNNTNKKFHK